MGRRFHTRGSRFQLVSAEDGRTPIHIVRHISFDEGMNMIRRETAEPVLDEVTAGIIGFQLRVTRGATVKKRAAPERDGAEMALVSQTAFTEQDVAAIAGTNFPDGKSRTALLNDEARAERIRRGWMAEDQVERAQEKLRVYSHTH